NPVGKLRRMAGRERLRGSPESHDVVVRFPARWNLDQFNGSRTPLAFGLHPRTRTAFILGIEILKVRLRAGALYQTETDRRLRRKSRHLESYRIGELGEYFFPALARDLQAIRILNPG